MLRQLRKSTLPEKTQFHAGAIILRDRWRNRIGALEASVRDGTRSRLGEALDEHEIILYRMLLNELITCLGIPEN